MLKKLNFQKIFTFSHLKKTVKFKKKIKTSNFTEIKNIHKYGNLKKVKT